MLCFSRFFSLEIGIAYSNQVHGTKSVKGISSKMLTMFFLCLTCRLTSTCLKNGYFRFSFYASDPADVQPWVTSFAISRLVEYVAYQRQLLQSMISPLSLKAPSSAFLHWAESRPREPTHRGTCRRTRPGTFFLSVLLGFREKVNGWVRRKSRPPRARYLPQDKSGDYMYQVLDICSLGLVLHLLYPALCPFLKNTWIFALSCRTISEILTRL